jgi:hypothetical protein
VVRQQPVPQRGFDLFRDFLGSQSPAATGKQQLMVALL